MKQILGFTEKYILNCLLKLCLTQNPNSKSPLQSGFFIYSTLKYHKLSEAQFNEMHREFTLFLASQNIDKRDWLIIKSKKPELVDKYLNSFSDLVWEKILSNCQYLEFSTVSQIFLFHTKENSVDALIVKIDKKLADLNTAEGFKKVLTLLKSEKVDIFESSNVYTPSRNEFIYDYLRKGSVISDGKRYELLKSYFYNSAK